MEPAEYRRMFAVEDALWWYRALRLHLGRAIAAAGPGRTPALDAGCGTGANLQLLGAAGRRAVGVDLAPAAVTLARERGARRLAVADVNQLPFPAGAFDLVLCADVFECVEVDERAALAELARVTRPGGRIIVAVAAYQWLHSEHDRAVHSVRRYTRARARRVFTTASLRVARARYLFGLFLAPIAAYRLLRRARGPRAPGAAPVSDNALPHPLVNGMLLALARAEFVAGRVASLPFGSTLLLELDRV